MNIALKGHAPPASMNDGAGVPPNWEPSQRLGPEDEPVDIRGILRPFWRRKGIIFACALAGVAAGIFIAANMEPRFSASARVIFDPERLKIIDLDNVVVSPDTTTTGLQNQIEILRSAVLLERVADLLRLQDTPEFNTDLRVGPPPLVERVAERASSVVERLPLPQSVRDFLIELGAIEPPPDIDNPTDQDSAADELRSKVVKQLVEDMNLRPIPNSRVIEIGYNSSNSGLAASIVNAVAEQYIAVQIEKKRDDVAAATELLSVRVQDLENRLNSSEEALEMARLELSRSAGHTSKLTDEQLEGLTESVTAARQDRMEFERRFSRASDALADDAQFAVVPEFRGSEIIAGYRLRESALQDEAASLRAIVGESNPNLMRIDARLSEVRGNIRTEAETIVASLESDLAAAREREASLTSELQELEGKALEQSKDEMRLARLEREATASRSIYESFVNRLKETSEQAGLQTPDARFLTRAAIPTRRDSRLLSIGLATLGGLLAGVGLVFLLEKLNNTFRSQTDLEAKTGLSVLGAIPRVGRRKRLPYLMAKLAKDSDTPLSEAMRNLRTSVFYSNIDQPPKVIMLTSSVPAEGKTTAAMLFAIASQQMERSAIVVDCDFRRRTLGSLYDFDTHRPGLLAVLDGSTPVASAVYTEAGSGVHILAREGSHLPGNSADVFASKRFRKLIDELRLRYDVVILDTPPVLAVSDARILCQVADAVVYLVRWNKTQQEAVTDGLRVLRSVNAKIAGLVLSLVNERQATGYYIDKRYYRLKKQKKSVSA